MTHAVSFSDLPTDVLSHIFSFLDGNDIINMTTVSHYFRQLVRDNINHLGIVHKFWNYGEMKTVDTITRYQLYINKIRENNFREYRRFTCLPSYINPGNLDLYIRLDENGFSHTNTEKIVQQGKESIEKAIALVKEHDFDPYPAVHTVLAGDQIMNDIIKLRPHFGFSFLLRLTNKSQRDLSTLNPNYVEDCIKLQQTNLIHYQYTFLEVIKQGSDYVQQYIDDYVWQVINDFDAHALFYCPKV